MIPSARTAAFKERITSFEPGRFSVPRWLAMFAAGIASADSHLQEEIVNRCKDLSIERTALYEVVLQSYLFLGFPRMLIAVEALEKIVPRQADHEVEKTHADNEIALWHKNGLALCKRIYGDNFEPLQARVESMAPEIFRWMIFEGYGKVLSRPGLGPMERELANVAMLTYDNREQQLHSHLRGALNVGASPELLKLVVGDLADLTDGYATALRLLARLKVI
jgi:4-carboxymuconolactone decarboxylase